MRSVYKRIISCAVFLCHSFIGNQHKIFNDPGCHIGFIRLHINSSSCRIQDDLTFREIKINGTSCMTAAAQDPGKLFSSGKTWGSELHSVSSPPHQYLPEYFSHLCNTYAHLHGSRFLRSYGKSPFLFH